MKSVISFIFPVFNESKNIPLRYEEVIWWMHSVNDKYDYEMIFVDDGSLDDSWEKIEWLCQKNKNVVGIQLSRNFGYQYALRAWYESAKWDAIITLDADGQDPVGITFDMIKKWEEGYEIVFGKRIERSDSFLKKYTSNFYYKLLSFVSETNVVPNAGDFRLISKKVLKIFLKLHSKDTYMRGIFSWIGFRMTFVEYKQPKRVHGKTWYTIRKMVRLGMDGILNFSLFPIRIGFLIWVFLMLFSLIVYGYMVYNFFVHEIVYSFLHWWFVGIFWIIGLLFIFIWILWEYIGKTYYNTLNRPQFIISQTKNIYEEK